MKDCLSLCVPEGAITKVISVFGSMRYSLVHKLENCGQKHTKTWVMSEGDWYYNRIAMHLTSQQKWIASLDSSNEKQISMA